MEPKTGRTDGGAVSLYFHRQRGTIVGSRGYRAGHKEYMKEYFRRNPKKYLLEAAKKRAKIKNLDIDITEDDFDIPEFCPILGIKLSPVRSKDRIYSPSIDRRDNS